MLFRSAPAVSNEAVLGMFLSEITTKVAKAVPATKPAATPAPTSGSASTSTPVATPAPTDITEVLDDVAKTVVRSAGSEILKAARIVDAAARKREPVAPTTQDRWLPAPAGSPRPGKNLPLPTITGLILGEIGRLVKEPPDRKKQRKIPLFITVHRKHLMIEE